MIVDRYYLAKRLSVKGLTTFQPDLLFGFAMPTAIAGFAHKLQLDFNSSTGRAIKVVGTAMIVHDYRVLEGQAKLPPPKTDLKPAALVFDLRADARISFIFSVDADGNDIALDDFEIFLDKALLGANFGGGKIFPMSEKSVVAVEELGDLQNKVDSGYILLDRAEVLEDYMKSPGVDGLDAILDIAELVRQNPGAPKDEEKVYTRRLRGWLVGISVGYQAINEPVLRDGTRISDGVTKHVYAESIYSIGEYQSVTSAFRSEENLIAERAFWRHCHDQQTHTFFVSATNH